MDTCRHNTSTELWAGAELTINRCTWECRQIFVIQHLGLMSDSMLLSEWIDWLEGKDTEDLPTYDGAMG